MDRRFLPQRLLAALCALSFIASLTAQVVSSGITGVVLGANQKPQSGATVTAVHVPTNATFNAGTAADGRFYFRGLPVGGPYTVTATVANQTPETVNDVYTMLGTDVDVNVVVGGSGVIKLERFEVVGERSALDSGAVGA